MIENSKKAYFKEKLKDADTKSVFRIVNGLLNNNNKKLPTHNSVSSLYVGILPGFSRTKLRISRKNLKLNQLGENSNDSYNRRVVCLLSEFPTLSEDDVSELIKGFAAIKAACLTMSPYGLLKIILTSLFQL